jgi:hypothetical protein
MLKNKLDRLMSYMGLKLDTQTIEDEEELETVSVLAHLVQFSKKENKYFLYKIVPNGGTYFTPPTEDAEIVTEALSIEQIFISLVKELACDSIHEVRMVEFYEEQ